MPSQLPVVRHTSVILWVCAVRLRSLLAHASISGSQAKDSGMTRVAVQWPVTMLGSTRGSTAVSRTIRSSHPSSTNSWATSAGICPFGPRCTQRNLVPVDSTISSDETMCTVGVRRYMAPVWSTSRASVFLIIFNACSGRGKGQGRYQCDKADTNSAEHKNERR